MFGVLSAWLVEVMIIVYRDVKRSDVANNNLIGGLPLPADFVGTFVVFGALGALAEVDSARTVAGLAAWGFVVATAVNILNPSNPLHPLASSSSSSAPTSSSSSTPTTKAA